MSPSGPLGFGFCDIRACDRGSAADEERAHGNLLSGLFTYLAIVSTLCIQLGQYSTFIDPHSHAPYMSLPSFFSVAGQRERKLNSKPEYLPHVLAN